MRHASWLWLLFVTSACPPTLRRPESTQLVVTGTLTTGGFAKRGEPLEAASVVLRRADDGSELASNLTSSAGGYRLSATVEAGTRVVLVAQHASTAPIARAFTAGPSTELVVSASLSPLEALECVDAFCAAPLVELEWAEPPQGAAGRATSFGQEAPLAVEVDPTRPSTLALAWAHLEGGTTGTLRLRVPRAAWSALTDVMPGNGTLEVPAARFDPKTAKWTRQTVPLESEAGLALTEAALTGLRAGDAAGGAVAVFPFASDVFLAVLGAPVSTGCVSGTMRAEGQAAEGATFAFPGFEPVAAGKDGSFCAPAPIGGTSAPAQSQYAGLPYSLEARAQAAGEGRCGGSCTSLGEVKVEADALRISALCSLAGKVLDGAGAPIANAEVVALDESVTGNATTAFCGKTGAKCALTAPSAADGTFSLRAPLLNALFVGARVSTTGAAGEGTRSAAAVVTTCPTAPLTLTLDRGVLRLEVAPSFSGAQLSWTPGQPAARVTVLDGAGLPKWEVASASGLTSPLTFGTIPPGAAQTVAPTGTPASGDTLVVELEGVGRDGVVFTGTGTATRP